MADIRGTTEAQFEELAEVFEKNFELHDEVGAGSASERRDLSWVELERNREAFERLAAAMNRFRWRRVW